MRSPPSAYGILLLMPQQPTNDRYATFCMVTTNTLVLLLVINLLLGLFYLISDGFSSALSASAKTQTDYQVFESKE